MQWSPAQSSPSFPCPGSRWCSKSQAPVLRAMEEEALLSQTGPLKPPLVFGRHRSKWTEGIFASSPLLPLQKSPSDCKVQAAAGSPLQGVRTLRREASEGALIPRRAHGGLPWPLAQTPPAGSSKVPAIPGADPPAAAKDKDKEHAVSADAVTELLRLFQEEHSDNEQLMDKVLSEIESERETISPATSSRSSSPSTPPLPPAFNFAKKTVRFDLDMIEVYNITPYKHWRRSGFFPEAYEAALPAAEEKHQEPVTGDQAENAAIINHSVSVSSLPPVFLCRRPKLDEGVDSLSMLLRNPSLGLARRQSV